jgi:hypothetical protein
MPALGVGDNAFHHQERPQYPHAADARQDDPLDHTQHKTPRTAARVTRTGFVPANTRPHQAPTPEHGDPCEREAGPKPPPDIVERGAVDASDPSFRNAGAERRRPPILAAVWPKSSKVPVAGNEQFPEHRNVIGSRHDNLRDAFAVKACARASASAQRCSARTQLRPSDLAR